jgi:hypothetical protein
MTAGMLHVTNLTPGSAAPTQVPVHVVPRRLQRPLEKLRRVLEAEHLVVVLHVVFIQQVEHLPLGLLVRRVVAVQVAAVACFSGSMRFSGGNFWKP